MDKVTVKLTTEQEIHLPKELAQLAGFEQDQTILACQMLDIARQIMDQFDEEFKILASR